MKPSIHHPYSTVVTRTAVDGAHSYLKLVDGVAVAWVEDPHEASVFESMREATRMAFRLPAACRAFGMPAEVETEAFRTVH